MLMKARHLSVTKKPNNKKKNFTILMVLLAITFTFSVAEKSSIASEMPIPGGILTSDFGPRGVSGDTWHRGIDYAQANGAQLRAVESGNPISGQISYLLICWCSDML